MDFTGLRPFNLRCLHYFMVLSEELHFGRAATRLNMSQPPLSQQIRQLEENLGVELFHRSHHSVALTQAGRALRDHVPLVFEQLEKAVMTTRLTARGQVGRLDIGVISSSLVGVIPAALEAFRDSHPHVEWQLHELTPSRQIQDLLERRIDICLFRMASPQEGLQCEMIMQEDLTVALPKSHPLTDKHTLSLTELRDQPFVMFGLRQSRFATYLHECCVKAGFIPHIRQQVLEVQTMLSLVGANMGVALLPASMRALAPSNVVFRDLQAAPQIPLYAVYRENDLTPTLQQFLRIIRNMADHSSRG